MEFLEGRQLLTGVTVEADAASYVEGQTAWYAFTLSEPAAKAFSLDLLLSGGPAGPTGYVMPISQGQTSAHVGFPTSDNSTPGDSYTMLLEITGSSESGPNGPSNPLAGASTNVLDNDGPEGPIGPSFEFNESSSGPSGPPGPTGPTSVTLNQPPEAYEGTPFQLTGTILPPYSSFNYSVTGNYGGMQYDPQTGNFTVMIRLMDDGPSPGNDTPSDEVTLTMSVWASGSPPGSGVSDDTTVTVHNVDPTLLDPDDQHLLIDIYDYPPGGPNFIVSGFFLDDGTQDEHLVTIDWGDDSIPTEFVPEGNSIYASHHYQPDGGSHTITVIVEDDDTGFTSHSETISMYRLDLDNDADNDGYINEDDDPIENMTPGQFIVINDDNDNEMEVPEIVDMLEDGPIENEDELEPVLIGWSPANRPYEPVNTDSCIANVL